MHAKSLLTLMLWLALSGSALCSPPVTLSSDDYSQPQVRSLVAAYSQYADAIKQHGVEGLKKIASPRLSVQWGGRAFSGDEAFAEMSQPLNGLQDGTFLVNIKRITISGNTAVALTEETAGRKRDTQTMVTTKRSLKQTWQKTPQGWELEASDQRSPIIKGEAPAITYTLGSSADTPLTINMSDPETGLDVPPPPRDLMAQFDLYVGAASRHDDAAFLSLLTPGFTCTIDGKPLSHPASLKLTREIQGMMKTYPGYSLTINKLFVKPTTATAFIEEKFKVPDPHGSITIFTYVPVQHWVKTEQGWRLNNLARTII